MLLRYMCAKKNTVCILQDIVKSLLHGPRWMLDRNLGDLIPDQLQLDFRPRMVLVQNVPQMLSANNLCP